MPRKQFGEMLWITRGNRSPELKKMWTISGGIRSLPHRLFVIQLYSIFMRSDSSETVQRNVVNHQRELFSRFKQMWTFSRGIRFLPIRLLIIRLYSIFWSRFDFWFEIWFLWNSSEEMSWIARGNLWPPDWAKDIWWNLCCWWERQKIGCGLWNLRERMVSPPCEAPGRWPFD